MDLSVRFHLLCKGLGGYLGDRNEHLVSCIRIITWRSNKRRGRSYCAITFRRVLLIVSSILLIIISMTVISFILWLLLLLLLPISLPGIGVTLFRGILRVSGPQIHFATIYCRNHYFSNKLFGYSLFLEGYESKALALPRVCISDNLSSLHCSEIGLEMFPEVILSQTIVKPTNEHLWRRRSRAIITLLLTFTEDIIRASLVIISLFVLLVEVSTFFFRVLLPLVIGWCPKKLLSIREWLLVIVTASVVIISVAVSSFVVFLSTSITISVVWSRSSCIVVVSIVVHTWWSRWCTVIVTWRCSSTLLIEERIRRLRPVTFPHVNHAVLYHVWRLRIQETLWEVVWCIFRGLFECHECESSAFAWVLVAHDGYIDHWSILAEILMDIWL